MYLIPDISVFKYLRQIIVFIFCGWCGTIVGAHVTNFSPSDYQAAGQNWSVIIWKDHVYCANSDGLLRYNGNDWETLSVPSQSEIKVVEVYNNRIYAAGQNNLGYWTFPEHKRPVYHSMNHQLHALGIDDITFWSIAYTDSTIYFQSFSHIVGCRDDSCFLVVNQDCYSTVYPCGDHIYTQHVHGGLYEINEGHLQVRYENELLQTNDIQFCLAVKDSDLLIGLSNGSIYHVHNENWAHVCDMVSATGFTQQFSSACLINDSTVILGTRGSGLFSMNLSNGTYAGIVQNQLNDLNVHDVYYKDDAIWAALDNGIAHISLHSGQEILAKASEKGVLVSAIRHHDILWVATNRGLFITSDLTAFPISGLPLHLFTYGDELFCGTMTSLFRLDPTGIGSQWPVNGVQQTETVLEDNQSIVFLRSYSGLGILRKNKRSFDYTPIAGTSDCQLMMPESARNIWVIQNSGRLSRLHLDPMLTSVESSVDFPTNRQQSIQPISILNVDNRLLFVCRDGIYTYNAEDSTFLCSSMRWGNQDAIKTAVHKSGNDVWVVADDFLYLYRVVDMHSELMQRYALCGTPLLLYNEAYALFPDGDNIIFGTGDGIMRMSTNSASAALESKPYIEYCTYELKGRMHYAAIHNNRVTIPAKATNITLHATMGIAYASSYLSYLITPQNQQWSEWQPSGKIALSALFSGVYHLSLQGTFGQYISEIQEIEIVAKAPFYATFWAYLLYFCLLLLLFFVVMQILLYYKTRKLREQSRIEREKQEALLNAERAKVLAIKVANQDAELQSNLRLLTQKQELIDTITDELNKQNPDNASAKDGYKRLLKIVQNKDTKQSKIFSLENYFMDVQKDFITRIQPMFPNLTQAELRLCCMIRSNLMTKEIAAIFAIAPRSVELKKYRLKKHLGLPPEADLNSYIMSL